MPRCKPCSGAHLAHLNCAPHPACALPEGPESILRQHVGWAKERSDVPIRIQWYDDGHGPSGLCPSDGFFATIGYTLAIQPLTPPQQRAGDKSQWAQRFHDVKAKNNGRDRTAPISLMEQRKERANSEFFDIGQGTLSDRLCHRLNRLGSRKSLP